MRRPPTDGEVVTEALRRACDAVEYHAAAHDRDMIRIVGAVARELLGHPAAHGIAKAQLDRFRAFERLVEAARVSDREIVEHWLGCYLAEARQRLFNAYVDGNTHELNRRLAR